MKISLLFQATVLDRDDIIVPMLSADTRVDVLLAESAMERYLDTENADLGIEGGTVRLNASNDGSPVVRVDFWCPSQLDDAQLSRLIEDTKGQLADGVGSDGFPFDYDGNAWRVVADGGEPIIVHQSRDERQLPEPPILATAARQGDEDRVRSLIADGRTIDRRLQGYTPLHWAILFGRVAIVNLLIDAGADVNARGNEGQSAVELAVTSSSLTDADTEHIVRRLLAQSVDPEAGLRELSLVELAEIHGKLRTAQLFR